MLTLGWPDGYSFVPVGFNLLSLAKKSNRYREISDKVDCRSNGYKARRENLLPKPDAAALLAGGFLTPAYGRIMSSWTPGLPRSLC